MTTPRDTEPLAPRRPLGKGQATADGPSVPAPSNGSKSSSNGRSDAADLEATGQLDAVPAETDAAATTSGTSTKGNDTAYKPGPGTSTSDSPAAKEGTDDERERVDPDAMVAPLTAPSTFPAYTPSTQRVSPADIETQAALPPVSPVPPAPAAEPTAPAAVDKKAERAAQKAQRRLEQSKPRTIRRAKLRVVRVDPWSVTKAAFLLSIAFGIMCVVAVFLVFSIMSASGLWDSVNTTIQGVVDQRPDEAFDIKDYVGMSRVMGITMLISAIDVVIITALATLGAFIYNMAASLLGGVEVTLAEDLN